MLTRHAAAPVRFAPPAIGPDEMADVMAVLESGWLTTGPRVQAFESAFAAYAGAPHAVALNSCTAALHLSLLVSGVGAGDEVITTPLTFCATANTIVHTGATPVFADVDASTGNIDPRAVEAALTPRTRAMVAVHYAGRPADVSALRAIARRHGLVYIEDAAHAVESVSNAGKAGATADFTCFSFYATKNLTTGEGGMLTTADPAAADRARVLSLHGMSRHAWNRYAPGARQDYEVVAAGFKYNMMDVQAAIGLRQLERIDAHLARRARIWARYDQGLAGLPLERPAAPEPGTVHARHLYTVLVDARRACLSRDRLQDALREDGIGTSVHFNALHLQPFYARYGYRAGDFPHAERIAASTLSLPLSPALTDDEIDRVIEAVRAHVAAV